MKRYRLDRSGPMRDPLFLGYVVFNVVALVALFFGANGGQGVRW